MEFVSGILPIILAIIATFITTGLDNHFEAKENETHYVKSTIKSLNLLLFVYSGTWIQKTLEKKSQITLWVTIIACIIIVIVSIFVKFKKTIGNIILQVLNNTTIAILGSFLIKQKDLFQFIVIGIILIFIIILFIKSFLSRRVK